MRSPTIELSFAAQQVDAELQRYSRGLLCLRAKPDNFHEIITVDGDSVFQTHGLHAVRAIISAIAALEVLAARREAR